MMTVKEVRAALLLLPADSHLWWSEFNVEWMETTYYAIGSIGPYGEIKPETFAPEPPDIREGDQHGNLH